MVEQQAGAARVEEESGRDKGPLRGHGVLPNIGLPSKRGRRGAVTFTTDPLK